MVGWTHTAVDDVHFLVHYDVLWFAETNSVFVPDREVSVAQHGVCAEKSFDPADGIGGSVAVTEDDDAGVAGCCIFFVEGLEVWSQTSTAASGEATQIKHDHITCKVVKT